MTKKIQRVLSFIFALVIVLTSIDFSNKSIVGAQKTYIGKTINLGKKGVYFQAVDKDSGEVLPAYCWDNRLTRPDGEEYISTNEQPQIWDNKDVEKEEQDWYAKYETRKILFNGYPTDAAGIKEAYGLTDADFATITQRALWQHRHGDNFGGLIKFAFENGSDKFRRAYAYQMLLTGKPLENDPELGSDNIGKAKGITLQEPPENFKVKIFHNNQVDGENKPIFQRLAIVDYKTTPVINFTKTDARGKALSGVEFVLEKNEGENVKEWTSKDYSEKLDFGEIESPTVYTIKEKQPLDGYKQADEIKFRLAKNQNGKNTIAFYDKEKGEFGTEQILPFNYNISMVNEKLKSNFFFKKVNNENSPLSGASFDIFLKDDPNVKVASFESDANEAGKEITLDRATSYILKEAKVPLKYRKMADVEFRVDGNGTLTVEGNRDTDVEVENNNIKLKNFITTEPFVEVVKKDSLDSVLPGASFKLTAETEKKDVFVGEGLDTSTEVDDERKITIEAEPKYYYRTRGNDGSRFYDTETKEGDIQAKELVERSAFIKSIEPLSNSGNGQPGVRITWTMNKIVERWGSYRPYYFITVPKGLIAQKIDLKGTYYDSPENFDNNASRQYYTIENGHYDGGFDSYVRKDYDPKRLFEAKEKNNAMLINIEGIGTANGDFVVDFSFDPKHPVNVGDELTFVAGLNTNNTISQSYYSRNVMTTFKVPGEIIANSQVATWESTGESKPIKLNIDKKTTFTLEETQAPGGFEDYKLKTKFTVDTDGSIEVLEDGYADSTDGSNARRLIKRNPSNPNEIIFVNEVDEEYDVKFVKKSSKKEILDGADITIYDILGNEVHNFISTQNPENVKLKVGKYKILENSTKLGYKKFEEEIEFEVKVGGEIEITKNNENAAILNQNEKTIELINKKAVHEIFINKLGFDGNNLENAEFELTEVTTSKNYTIITSNSAYRNDIAPGKYILKEIVAPQGYKKVQDISFELLDDGTIANLVFGANDSVAINSNKKNQLDIVNKHEDKLVKVTKNNEDQQGLVGARINIIEKVTSNVVADWLTKADTTTKELNLAPGTYTFREVSSPDGYFKVADFDFTVGDDGNVTTSVSDKIATTELNELKVVDKKSKPTITISKIDLGGIEIAGAEIQILNEDDTPATIFDANNEQISEGKWTSEKGKTKEIRLDAGIYKFHEVAAPQGYVKVTDIKFSVDSKGVINILEKSDDVIASASGSGLEVVNNKENTKLVKFSKVNLGGIEIENAVIRITQNGQKVTSWVSEANKVHEVSLEPGKYTFNEVVAPDGYKAITEFTFNVLEDGSVTFDNIREGEFKYEDGKVVVTNKPKDEVLPESGTDYVFSKQDVAGAEVEGAIIEIYKVVDDNETLIANWTSGKTEKTVKLENGNYIFKEKYAPEGLNKVNNISFKVENSVITVTNINGNPQNSARTEGNKITVLDEYKLNEINISKVDIENEFLSSASLEIYKGDSKLFGWESSNSVKSLRLAKGTYTLKETKSPDNYVAIPNIKFDVDAKGNITNIKMISEENGEEAVRKANGSEKLLVSSVENNLFVINEKVEEKIDKPNGELATTVGVGTKKASNAKELEVTIKENSAQKTVVDTVLYKNLVVGKKYQITGQLMKIKDGETTKVAESKSEVFTAVATEENNDKARTVTVTFNDVNIEAGAKYVVFEKAESTTPIAFTNSTEPHVVTHENVDDKAQTLVVSKGKLATTVGVGENKASENKELEVIIQGENATKTVVDTVVYENLIAGEKYTMTGKLMKIVDGQDPVQVGKVATAEFTAVATEENNIADRTVTITFNDVNIEAGAKYVVFEKAESKNALIDETEKHTVTHEDVDDKSQTLVVSKGKLSTTVGVGKNKASESKELELIIQGENATKTVVDTVVYENLIAGEEYIMTGKLMKIVDGQDPVQVGKVATAEFTAVETEKDNIANRTVTITFNDVNIEAGAKYVVFEKAESKNALIDETEKHTVTHEDVNDKAQTLVVSKGKLATTVGVGKNKASESKELQVIIQGENATKTVVDTVVYENLIAGEKYTMTGKLMKIVDGQDPEQVGDVATAEFTAVETEKDNIVNRTVTITFNDVNIEAGAKYVVFEKAESQNVVIDGTDKHIVTHEDKNDKSQTLVVKNIGKIRTTVTADDITASEYKPAVLETNAVEDGVVVKDTINYEGLVARKSYKVVATLKHVAKDGTVTDVEGAKVEKEFTADDSGNGSWEVNFESVEGLKVGEKYVVYEVATSVEDLLDTDEDGVKEKHVLKHEDPDDSSQTFIAKSSNLTGEIRTIVTADDVTAIKNKPAMLEANTVEDGVVVKDTIKYEGLVGEKVYKVVATLKHVANDGTVTDVEGAKVEKDLTTDKDGYGKWEVDFGTVKGLKVGERYVVYEVATSVEDLVDNDKDGNNDAKHVLRHEDPTDKAQTFVIKPIDPQTPAPNPNQIGKLRTTVTADEITAREDSPAVLEATSVEDGVVVKDTINYEGLVSGKVYKVVATLKHVAKDGTVTDVEGAKVEKEFTADNSGNGSWEVNFGAVEGLKAGEKYVVYEAATSVEDLVDPDGDKVNEPHVLKHEDPNDKAQTFVVNSVEPESPKKVENPTGKIRTTVTAGDITASEEKVALLEAKAVEDGVVVKDTINYEGLVAGKVYKVVATLKHVAKDGTVTDVEGAKVEKEFTADDSGNGSWEVNFESVESLKAGEKYVVYELATSVEDLIDNDKDGVNELKHVLRHEDPNDKAQTFVVKVKNQKGTLRTTVVANNVEANKNEAAIVDNANLENGVSVVDTIDYSELKSDKQYNITATLVRITKDGFIEIIETKKDTFTTDASGSGKWVLDFGLVKGLKEGEKYVIYERAESVDNLMDEDLDGIDEAKHIVYHSDPTDRAQTFVIGKKSDDKNDTNGSLRTTVTANDVRANKKKEAIVENADLKKGVRVVDTINYTNLKSEKEYNVIARLMHITKQGTIIEVATKEEKFVTDSGGTGMWKVDFGFITGLEEGEKYVIYEEAESVENLVNTDENEDLDSKHIVIHKDPTDKAQTFVISPKNPNPNNPNNPGGENPNNPNPNDPNNPGGENPNNPNPNDPNNPGGLNPNDPNNPNPNDPNNPGGVNPNDPKNPNPNNPENPGGVNPNDPNNPNSNGENSNNSGNKNNLDKKLPHTGLSQSSNVIISVLMFVGISILEYIKRKNRKNVN